MKKRFIACHQPGTGPEDQAFKNWLTSQGFGWWHWIGGSWVLIDPTGKSTVEHIRNALNSAYPRNYCMVFEHGSDRYAGTGPEDDARRELMANWLAENWKDY